MVQSFTVPGRLPGLNEYTYECRCNPRSGARMKREAEEAVMWAARAAHLKRMRPPVHVHVSYYEPNKRRDKDNVYTAIKFILDALVKIGVLGNDNWEWIGGDADCGVTNECHIDRDEPRVAIELKEI